jgi:hypothetical protein
VASWFQSSGIKVDVTSEWEKQTCLAFNPNRGSSRKENDMTVTRN